MKYLRLLLAIITLPYGIYKTACIVENAIKEAGKY